MDPAKSETFNVHHTSSLQVLQYNICRKLKFATNLSLLYLAVFVAMVDRVCCLVCGVVGLAALWP